VWLDVEECLKIIFSVEFGNNSENVFFYNAKGFVERLIKADSIS
jgi:hypothetical protein